MHPVIVNRKVRRNNKQENLLNMKILSKCVYLLLENTKVFRYFLLFSDK